MKINKIPQKVIKIKLTKTNEKIIILNSSQFDSYLNEIYLKTKQEFKNETNNTKTN